MKRILHRPLSIVLLKVFKDLSTAHLKIMHSFKLFYMKIPDIGNVMTFSKTKKGRCCKFYGEVLLVNVTLVVVRGLEMLVFRKIIRTYLIDDPVLDITED